MARQTKNNTDATSAIGDELLANGVHRRSFLQFVAAAFGASLVPEAISGCADPAPIPTGKVAAPFDFATLPAPTWVVRPDDMLSLGVQMANLGVDTNRNIVATSTTDDAYVVLTFPSQHVTEGQLNWPGAPAATQLVSTRAAGATRVVFKLPAGFTPVPYSIQGILSLCALGSTQVAQNALSTAGLTVFTRTLTSLSARDLASPARARLDRALAAHDPAAIARHSQRVQLALGVTAPILPILTGHHVGTTPARPADGETSLEIPHRVMMSPTENAVWRHATTPVTDAHTQRTELWHTRMAMRDPSTGVVDERLGGRTLRALWTRDWDIWSGGAVPTAGAMDGVNDVFSAPQYELPKAMHRDRLVRYTGDLSGSPTAPLALDRLVLTPFGATVDMKGAFPQGDDQLKAYTHDVHLGRDEYVEIQACGWLLPCMHQATVLKIAKRNTDPAQGAVGQMYAWTVLLVGKPLASFADGRDDAAAPLLRRWPFAGVEILQTSIECTINGNPAGTFGWVTPKSGGTTPLQIRAKGIDVAGSNVNVRHTTPLFFISDPSQLDAAIGAWNAGPPGNGGPVVYALDGQRVGYAPSDRDQTTYETSQLTVTLGKPAGYASTLTNVVPKASGITVAVDAIRHLTGNPTATTTFEYHDTYAQSGFDPGANPNEVFFTVSNLASAPAMALSTANKTGGVTPGFVTPDMSIALLSRKLGAVSARDTSATSPALTGGFNPSDLFGDLPKLFGFIKLTDVLTAVGSGAEAFMPKCVTQALANVEHLVAEIEALYQKVQTAVAQVQAFAAQVQQDVAAAQAALNDIQAKIAQGTATATDYLNQKTLTDLVSTVAPAQTQALTAILTALNGGGGKPGLVADVQKLVSDIGAGNFGAVISSDGKSGDLFAVLSDVSALLGALGAKDVASIVGGVQKDVQSAFDTINGFVADANKAAALFQEFQSLLQGLEMAKNLTVKLEWRPNLGGLVSATGGMFRPVSNQGLYLAIEVRAKALNGKPAGADVTCRLDQFILGFGADQASLNNAGLATANAIAKLLPSSTGGTGSPALDDLIKNAYVSLVFDHLQFQMLAGHKPDVDIVFKGIHFGGPLQFIETLRNSIPLDGFSDPPYVDITADHVEAGFTLALPAVAVGMFSLENLAISAAVQIPIVGDGSTFLNFRFAFCSKDHPFLVTVAMLGGGGFFALTMNEKGLDTCEAAIEVCAMISINLGVAAGCVSIEAGIYFKYTVGTGIELTGYLRIRGSMSILGLITLSVELYMSLTYYSATGKVIGHASITVEVDLGFWSTSVSVSCERKFAGSNGDPSFDDLMAPAADAPGQSAPSSYAALGPAPAFDPFADYCVAYAAA